VTSKSPAHETLCIVAFLRVNLRLIIFEWLRCHEIALRGIHIIHFEWETLSIGSLRLIVWRAWLSYSYLLKYRPLCGWFSR
jgi:hypothetical protein